MKNIKTTYVLLFSFFICSLSYSLEIRNEYNWNYINTLDVRIFSPSYILLHTTEGGRSGSERKLKKNNEAHYLVARNGDVVNIVPEERVSHHAGRSMWYKMDNFKNYSIGIEVEGTFYKEIPSEQTKSLKALLHTLKSRYNIPDVNVLTHSMVAYSSPDKWSKNQRRGRKKCGMIFSNTKVRNSLGLYDKPQSDPNLGFISKKYKMHIGYKSQTLIDYLYSSNYDPIYEGEVPVRKENLSIDYEVKYFNQVTRIHSPLTIAQSQYDSDAVFYHFPKGDVFTGDELFINGRTKSEYTMPVGTIISKDMMSPESKKQSVKKHNPVKQKVRKKKPIINYPFRVLTKLQTAFSIAGIRSSRDTVYLLPDNNMKTGFEMNDEDFRSLPEKTKVFVGYEDLGLVETTTYALAKSKWNSSSTIYVDYSHETLSFISGDVIDLNNIVPGKFRVLIKSTDQSEE